MIARCIIFSLFTITGSVCGQSRILDLDHADNTELEEFFRGYDVIAIGEVHGTQEVPGLVYRVAEMLSSEGTPFTVALEIHSDTQDAIHQFMRSGSVTTLLEQDYFEMSDGRTSKAMLQLLIKLRGLPGITVLCFDTPPGTENVNRDSVMGANLSNGYKTKRMLVLTGNSHIPASSARVGYPKSALSWFKDKTRSARTLILDTCFDGGTIWNCMNDGCKERNAYSNPGVSVPAGMKNFIHITTSDSTKSIHPDSFIYFQKVTASPPISRD